MPRVDTLGRVSEGLKRFRQPAAWLVLVAIVVLMAVDVVRLVLAVRGPTGPDAFAAHSLSLLSPVNAVVLLLAVAWCAVLRPITPGARKLTIVALVVALLGTVGQFVFGVIGLVRAGRRAGVLSAVIDAIGYLGFTILPVVAVVALAKILGGLRREEFRRIEAQEMTVELPRPGSAPAATDPETEINRPEDGQTEPTWRPDEASGAAWQTAGAAASGASASGWGRPGERGGWTPANRDSVDAFEEEPDENEEATVIRRLPDADQAEKPVRREPPQWTPRDRG